MADTTSACHTLCLPKFHHFFCRNMVKAYFTSFHMFGVVKGMEELNEEVRVYGVWLVKCATKVALLVD